MNRDSLLYLAGSLFLAVLLVVLITFVFPARSEAVTRYGSGCGIVPIKPITPIGCRDLRPVCHCDRTGRNCWWEWVCVR